VGGLSPLGIETVVTEDAVVGAFLASTESFDLVILDFGLSLDPRLEMLRFLLAERPPTPVIVLTARDQLETRDAVLKAGAAECLTKPLVFEELRERVTAHLRRGRDPMIWILTDVRYLAQRMPRALVDWMEAEGHAVQLAVADRDVKIGCLSPGEPAPSSSPWEGIAPGDLVVGRSRHPFALALIEEAEARGARTVNPSSAVRRVRNKVRATLALAEAGLPAPETFVARSPEELRRLPGDTFPLVLKPFLGDNAEGIRVVRTPGELDEIAWPDPLVLAQPFVESDGVDLKLYVVDQAVWAVRQPSPLLRGRGTPAQVPVDDSLRDLALGCGNVFGLRLYGVDVLESGGEQVVVDVNEFPNYTGVDEAPMEIGEVLLGEVGASRCAH
jgi:ribosomal protein S6--L-glutamate ligase